MTIPEGFVDVESPLLGVGAFYQGVAEDGIHLLILDKDAANVLCWGLRLPLHFNL